MLFDKIINTFYIKYYKIRVGEKFSCIGKLLVQGHGNYYIGNNVRIISKESVNPVGGRRTVLQTFGNGSIVIGNDVGISHAILCARKQITIEDSVLIGGGVKIYDNDFHSVSFHNRMQSPDPDIQSEEVVIREVAFVGAHSIILKGVTVGRLALLVLDL